MAQEQSDVPLIKVPSNLPELVRTAFHRARSNGDLLYYPTQVALLDVNSVPFQLRFSPALANKPKAPLVVVVPPPQTTDDPLNNPAASASTPPKPVVTFDPFDNPAEGLLVAQLSSPPSHMLVLNKFAVVPEHFILATTAFKEQTHLLEPADLAATLACIEAYYHAHNKQRTRSIGAAAAGGEVMAGGQEGENKEEERYGELFAFFNSGPHSGASQPHRHIQLLPVDRMRDGLMKEEEEKETGGGGGGGGGQRWEVLADRLVGEGWEEGDGVARKLPFRTFAERIRPGVGAEELHRVYLGLYRRACAAVARASAGRGGGREEEVEEEEQREGEARISYNMAMTRDSIVILPRLAEGAVIMVGGESKDAGTAAGKPRVVGKLALNGTVLAGTALVKSQAEWDLLRARPEMVVDLLGRIGVSPSQSKV